MRFDNFFLSPADGSGQQGRKPDEKAKYQTPCFILQFSRLDDNLSVFHDNHSLVNDIIQT